MTAAAFDSVTFTVWIGVLPVWFIWECLVLLYRSRDYKVRTISMVARDRAWQFTAAVFFWSAMPMHFWAPLGWASKGGTVAFWSIQAALLTWNIATWKWTSAPLAWWPAWLRWVNWPVWYLVLGPLAAALLFPQDGLTPWSPR